MMYLNKIKNKLKIIKLIIFNVFKTYKPLYVTSIILLSFFSLMLYGLSFENEKGNVQSIITTYILISVSVAIILLVFIIGFPIHYTDEYKKYKQEEAQKYYDNLRTYLTDKIHLLGPQHYVTLLYVSKDLYFINPYNNIHTLYNYVFIVDGNRHGKSAGLYKLEEEVFVNVNNFFEYV